MLLVLCLHYLLVVFFCLLVLIVGYSFNLSVGFVVGWRACVVLVAYVSFCSVIVCFYCWLLLLGVGLLCLFCLAN